MSLKFSNDGSAERKIGDTHWIISLLARAHEPLSCNIVVEHCKLQSRLYSAGTYSLAHVLVECIMYTVYIGIDEVLTYLVFTQLHMRTCMA